MDEAIAVERDRAFGADRHAEQAVVHLPQLPERGVGVAGTREADGHVLGEDGYGDGLHEIDGSRRQAIDVAGHDEPRAPRDPRRHDRGLLVDIVHVQQARRDDRALGDLVRAQLELLVTIPEDDALARDLVHHDHRVLIARVLDDRVAAIDAVVREFLPDATAVVIGAGDAHVLGPQPEPRARHQRRRHLPAATDRLAADPDLGEVALRLRHGRQPVDEIDGVGPETHHIPERL